MGRKDRMIDWYYEFCDSNFMLLEGFEGTRLQNETDEMNETGF